MQTEPDKQTGTEQSVRGATSGQPLVFAAILAGGVGVRMANPDKPKQYFTLGGKPILVHAVEKFCASGNFTHVLLLCPEGWQRQTADILERYCPQYANEVSVIVGGDVRNETIMNAIAYLEQSYEVDENTILVTHDSVRPFVSLRIIEDNIAAAQRFGACDTVIPATDTIVESGDGECISQIPDRSQLYQGQTPQSFKMLHFKELFEALSSEERNTLTDACKVYSLQGEQVALVDGDPANIKITYPHDLRVAEAMLGE